MAMVFTHALQHLHIRQYYTGATAAPIWVVILYHEATHDVMNGDERHERHADYFRPVGKEIA